MYLDYEWVKTYLSEAPSLEEAAALLNKTGLEAEIDGDGLEVEHTVNRPDAMCHFGVARELAVKTGAELLVPPVYEGEIPALQGFSIETVDPLECGRYIGLKVSGVRASATPEWLRKRLDAIGQTSHNFLVDLTNFLLWEFSHPSHAFDAKKLVGDKILIRWGEKGERLTTLDGRDHDVEGLLCIADAEKPIAFGGVMGGENTEVDENTTELLLELATFYGPTVRKTGNACDIHSDARHRFERGVDLEHMDRVIRRFLFLLLEEQPEAQVIGMFDMNKTPFSRGQVLLRRAKMDQLLGIELETEQVETLLNRMDFGVEKHAEGWQLTVPGYKVDVEREVDVIEELIRFAGFDLLKTELPALVGSAYQPNPLLEFSERLRDIMVGFGYYEACTYSFIPETWDQAFSGEGEAVRVRNPMNLNQAVMRRDLAPCLSDSILRNQLRGILELKLFEVSRVFRDGKEPHRLAVAFSRGKEAAHWWPGDNQHPFYQVKGIFEALRDRLFDQSKTRLTLKPGAPGYFQEGESLGIYLDERLIGGLGMLRADLVNGKTIKDWEFPVLPAYLEMEIEALAQIGAPVPDVAELPKHPGMKIDVAFVLDRDHGYEPVRDHILNLQPQFLDTLELFDVYEGKSLEKGKKSLGFRFFFQADQRTLTSEEVAATVDTVIDSVKQQFGAVVRS